MNDDENDYEVIQNAWDPEDPDWIMEQQMREFNAREYEDAQREEEEEAFCNHLEANERYGVDSAPMYRDADECMRKTKRDPLLKMIKMHRNKINDMELRNKYDEFIKKYDEPQKYYVPFFDSSSNGKIWVDYNGQKHSAYYCYDISPSSAGNLDPRLLIAYASYFIKHSGFPAWFDAFAGDENDSFFAGHLDNEPYYDPFYYGGSKAHKHLDYVQDNADKLHLNDVEKEIVEYGVPLKKGNEIECDYDSWWTDDDKRWYDIDENGRMVKL